MGKYWIVGVLILAVVLVGCPRAPAEPTATAQPPPPSTAPTAAETEATQTAQTESSGTQLMGPAETLEEARELAEQYGVELLRWNYGLAVYYTEENPTEVIRRAEAAGLPELSINHSHKLF